MWRAPSFAGSTRDAPTCWMCRTSNMLSHSHVRSWEIESTVVDFRVSVTRDKLWLFGWWESINNQAQSWNRVHEFKLDFQVQSELMKIPGGAGVRPVWHRTGGNTSCPRFNKTITNKYTHSTQYCNSTWIRTCYDTAFYFTEFTSLGSN